MTNVIPEEKIAEIRSAADIVDVVSGDVLLKKSGKNYLGLCPFHSEKTPSFTVSPDKQIFHCFGCGEGGNVFSFVMKQEGIPFPKAARKLARRYNIVLPDHRMNFEQKRRLDEKDRLYSYNQKGLAYYRQILNDKSLGYTARKYLQERGLNQDSIDHFQIGYAPAGWDNLLNYMVSKRKTPAALEKSGLVVPKKNRNGYYDRFRNRIMFPIVDISNRVVGFGGRVLNDDLPKYLNSPETPVYNKGRSLYGLNLAKPICRQTGQIIVVEGYFDVIALHQHGVRNAVATLGTSLTTEHVRLIKSCVGVNGKVLLVFDSDEAGIKAARRSIDVFDKEYVSAQILVLESGYDPDTYIFEHGAEAFRNKAAKAMEMIPFLLNTAIRRYGLSVDGKVKIISELQNALNSLSDVVARSLYVKMISEQLEIDEIALAERLKNTKTSTAPRMLDPSRTMNGEGNRPTALSKASDHYRLERQIIAMMLQVPGICPSVTHSEALSLIEDPKLKRIGNTIIEIYNKLLINSRDTAALHRSEYKQQQWIAEILNSLTDEKDRKLIADMAIHDEVWSIEGCEKQVLHFVETSQKKRLQRDIDTRIKEAIRLKDDDLVNELLVEKQSLAVKREKRKMALINRK